MMLVSVSVSSSNSKETGAHGLPVAAMIHKPGVALDTTSGTRGSDLRKMEPGTQHYEMNDALVWTLIDGADHGIEQPSGLALFEDTLLVTGHATGKIFAFDLEGNLVDWIDTGRGSD
jgi:hypothetical protein